MSASRVLLSVVVAWGAWVLGLVVMSLRGMDFMVSAMRRLPLEAEALVGLACIVLGSVLLALAAASLLLSWVGLMSVGVVQAGAALVMGFLWSSSTGLLLPSSVALNLVGQHMVLGVHLVLGLVAVGLALAAILRRGRGPASPVFRALSLLAVPTALAAGLLLTLGGGRNMRSMQTFQTVGSALVLIVLAALLLGLVATSGRLSGLGLTVVGGAWTAVAVAATLWPSEFYRVLPQDLFPGWLTLGVSGGYLPVGLLLLIGGPVVSVVARQARDDGREASTPVAHAPGAGWEHPTSRPTTGSTF